MAFGMKSWLGLTALGMALAGFSLWANRPPGVTEQDVEPHEVVYHRSLLRQAGMLERTLQRRAWSDSLSALTLAAADTEDRFVLGGPEPLSEGERKTKEAPIRSEIERMGGVRSDVVLGFFIQPRSFGAVTDRPARDERTTHEVYLGRRDGVTYCTRVNVVPDDMAVAASRNLSWATRYTSALGPCNLVARYGHPGEAIIEWLKDGGVRYALSPGGILPAGELRYWSGGMVAFGYRASAAAGASLQESRCRSGVVEGCADLLIRPAPDRDIFYLDEMIAPPTLLTRSGVRTRSSFGLLDDSVLADLAAEFGDERFERFWASDAPVAEAFKTAFDMEPGEWMLSWTARTVRIEPRGPAVALGSVASSMVLVSLCGLVGAAWARKREV